MSAAPDRLPIDGVLDDIDRTLAESSRLVLQAAPGAGKSTRVPLRLLDADWLVGGILLLEPRRVAARNLADYLARCRGGSLGETVGLQIRDERRGGPQTRLTVITEGILTRRLQADPELTGIGLVIFDEFHERHLQSDLGLALTLDVQRQLRSDLRVLIMSATLDSEALGAWLKAPVVRSVGRQYPVEIDYRPPHERQARSAETAAAVRELAAGGDGDVLVFLPGRREIEQVQGLLRDLDAVEVRGLYGDLPLAQQRAALTPGDRQRVVLSTNIAESSLTVPGVTGVVDAGLERAPQFDPRSGLTRLVTRRISAASAEQRAGRAGRLAPGRCLRMWSPSERLALATPPEMLAADLSSLVLEIKLWGADPATLEWLDPPPTGAWSQGETLLRLLGALDADGRPTALAERLLQWGTEPRLAAMLQGAGPAIDTACRLAALLEGRDPMPADRRDDDIASRLAAWREGRLAAPVRQRLEHERRRWSRRSASAVGATDDADPAAVLIHGWPDRVARRREGGEDYLLSGGRGVRLHRGSVLAGSDWLVVCDAALTERDGVVRLAARTDETTVRRELAGQITEECAVEWDAAAGQVRAERRTRLGAIVLERHPWRDPPPELRQQALLEGIRSRGTAVLPWSGAARMLRDRAAFAHRHLGADWPAWDESTLVATLHEWLAPWLAGATSLADVGRIDLVQVLRNRLGWDRVQALDRLVPVQLEIPSGRRATVDYSDPDQPVLAAKLQELFGLTRTPAVADGRVPLTIHLLSPAGRPLQITRDLPHFWRHGYPEVRKEMRGRYPKHPWPEDPTTATATHLTKAALARRQGD